MKTLAFNPYLPEWEHIPDGEPRVFGDRVYIYGSHDEDGGEEFCLLDYVCWSAPVDDLGNWRYEGIIYRKEQEPLQRDASIPGIPDRVAAGLPHLLFAPDVVQGKDGRYYLYYSMDFSNVISVAAADRPEGPFAFLSHVKRADGTLPPDIRWFDPAVLCDACGVYLYMGSAPAVHFPEMGNAPIPGGMGIRLADDMHTLIGEPFLCANGIETCQGTSYEAHPFFEASSIRHYGEWYYHIYSSLQEHELCYGDLQPTIYDADYQPDAVDAVSADLDVALIMYGATPGGAIGVTAEGPEDFACENPNLPAMFFAIGEDDTLVGSGNQFMAEYFRDKTTVEEHTFANVGHGFGVGSTSNNTEYWIDMAARFMLMATGGIEKQEVVLDVEVPEQYTKMQEFDYTMPFGDVHITCAMNEAEDAFYLYFTAFDDLQILEGVIEEGEPIVTFDRSGFMAGDAQNFLNQINPDAWVQR